METSKSASSEKKSHANRLQFLSQSMKRIDDFPALGRARSASATDIVSQLPLVYPCKTRQSCACQDFVVAIQYTLNIHLEDQAVRMVEHGRIIFFITFGLPILNSFSTVPTEDC